MNPDFLWIEGFSNLDVLLSDPPIHLQRVSTVLGGIRSELLAKTSNSFDPKENRKLYNEKQVLTRLYEFYTVSRSNSANSFHISMANSLDQSSIIMAEQSEVEDYSNDNALQPLRESSKGYLCARSIPQAITIEKSNDLAVLLLRNSTFVPLRSLLQETTNMDLSTTTPISGLIPPISMTLFEKVTFMHEATKVLEMVHQARFAHLNINPNAFLICPVTRNQIEMIDFRNAMSIGDSGITYHSSLSCNAKYISPEQSGQMNKKIDLRSDIYSLGITFWEVLVGKHPFEGDTNDKQVIYHQIVKKVPLMSTVNPEIPFVLSKIVAKMISKERSDRYQDITALKSDLSTLVKLNSNHGSSGALFNTSGLEEIYVTNLRKLDDFEIGTRDRSYFLIFEDKNINRKQDIQTLTQIFERDWAAIPFFFLVLKGKERAGRKSAIVRLSQYVDAIEGVCMLCESNERNRNPFGNMLEQFSKAMLSRSSEHLMDVRNSLLQGIGRDGLGQLIQIFGSIQTLMGAQFKAPLIGIDSASIFQTFRKFLHIAFIHTNIVVYLPNLLACPWATKFFRYLLTEKGEEIKCYFIVNFDNSKVSEFENIIQEASNLKPGAFQIMEVQEFTIEEIKEYLVSVLVPTKGDLLELATEIFLKCTGNPFYMKEIMSFCVKSNLFVFNEKEFCWIWDIEQIRSKLKITDNVVEDLIAKYHQLSPEIQKILQIAALFGNQFDCKLVKVALGPKQDLFEEAIEFLMTSQYLAKIKNSKKSNRAKFSLQSERFKNSGIFTYEYTSPKIRLHIIDSLSSERKGELCSNILLSKSDQESVLSQAQKYEQVFQIFNDCVDTIVDQTALKSLFSHNIYLAESSPSNAPPNDVISHYHNAYRVFQKIPTVLNETMDTQVFHARCEYAKLLICNNRQHEMDISKELEDLEKYTKGENQELMLVELQLANSQGRFDWVVQKCRESLTQFEFTKEAGENKLKELERIFRDNGSDIVNQQSVQEEEDINIREIMFCYGIALQMKSTKKDEIDRSFLIQACVHELTYGCNEVSCLFFALLLPEFLQPLSFHLKLYKGMSNYITGLFDRTNRVAKTASIFSAMNGLDLKWTVAVMTNHIKSFILECHGTQSKAVTKGIEIFVLYNFSIGFNFAEIEREYKAFDNRSTLHSYFLTECIESMNKGIIILENQEYPSWSIFANVLSSYLFGDYDDQCAAMSLVPKFIQNSLTATSIIDILILQFLIIVDSIGFDENGDQQGTQLKTIMDLKTQIMNYKEFQRLPEQACKQHLMEGEAFRLQNENVKAMKSYELAIETASRGNNIFIRAVSNECYGSMLAKMDAKKLAAHCIRHSSTSWTEFGCESKGRSLTTKYAMILQVLEIGKVPIRGKNKRQSFSRSSIIPQSVIQKEELSAVMELTVVLNKEDNLDKLLKISSKHIMTYANATKSVILLEQGDHISVSSVAILDDDGAIKYEETINSGDYSRIVPMKVVYYVWRSNEKLLLNDNLTWDQSVKSDEYLRQECPKSVLCVPIMIHDRITGVLYIENCLQKMAFTSTVITLVESSIGAAAVAIENAKLQLKNQELAKELEKKTTKDVKFTFDSPIQKVVDSLTQLKLKFEFDPKEVQNLSQIIDILNSDNIYRTSVGFDESMDLDTKKWIESTLMQSEVSANFSMTKKTDLSLEDQYTEPENTFNAYLELTEPMAFDVFKFAELTDNAPLLHLSISLFKEFRLFETLKISQEVAFNFFQRIETSYNPLPYHNSIHSADLLKTVKMLAIESPVAERWTDLEIASLFIACAIHDVDHPGVNNAFLQNISHPLAVLYNDNAVLENHHSAIAFEIARELPGRNIFGGIELTQFSQMRKMIVQLVLATDLAMHYQFLNKFKARLSGGLKMEDAADRLSVLELLVKCGDLSNPTRPFEQSFKWTSRVMSEFFQQGDREKAIGLSVSQFMDSNTTNIPKCQIGFIEFLVAPLYETWKSYSDGSYSDACCKNIISNRDQWKVFLENPLIMPSIDIIPQMSSDHLLDMNLMSLIKFGGGIFNSVGKFSLNCHSYDRSKRRYGSHILTTKENTEEHTAALSGSQKKSSSASPRPRVMQNDFLHGKSALDQTQSL